MPLFTQERVKLPTKSLRERYLVPPFSILDSQVGEWLKKRNEWEYILKNRSANVRNITAKSNTPYINKFDYDISLIVPIYNMEKYLETCLDSIVSQTIQRKWTRRY